ncbi:MAG: hypothetical protein ACKV2T_17165 [Kofleriaceae bacterium]
MNKPTLAGIGAAITSAIRPTPIAKLKTLDDLEASIAASLADEEAERAEQLADRQARAEDARAHADAVGSLRDALAALLGVDQGGLADALSFLRADAKRSAGVAFDVLASLLRPAPEDVDVRAVKEAVHVLAAEGILPPLEKRSVFGEVRSLRDLPAVRTEAPVQTLEWDQLVRSLGLPVIDREFGESSEMIASRIEERRRAGGFGRNSEERSREYATRALEIELEASRKANHDTLKRYRTALTKQRADIVAAIDVALAKTPLGIPWSWVRDLRRCVNDEPGRRTDALRALAACRVLGISIDVAKPAATTAPQQT